MATLPLHIQPILTKPVLNFNDIFQTKSKYTNKYKQLKLAILKSPATLSHMQFAYLSMVYFLFYYTNTSL